MDVQFGFYQCSPMLNYVQRSIFILLTDIMKHKFLQALCNDHSSTLSNESLNKEGRTVLQISTKETTTSHPKQQPLTPINNLSTQTTTSHPKQQPLNPNNNLSTQTTISHPKQQPLNPNNNLSAPTH